MPPQETPDEDRQAIADLIATVASWPEFAASVATKILHKKRPDLIPILDNEAIFKRILDDEEFQRVLAEYYLHGVYERLRSRP